MTQIQLHQYSLKEEIANSVIHGLGILLSIIGLTALLILASIEGTSNHFYSYLVYGSSLILLYTFSTLYHALPHPRAKKIFKVLDHSAIYLLIAGSYTPFLVLKLQGSWGPSLMVVIWTMAFLGILFKLFFTFRFKYFSTFIYLVMGWVIVVAIGPLMEVLSPEQFYFLVAGGLSYTFGTIFYLSKKIPYNHAIWHLFVLMGSIFHYVAIIMTSPLFL